MDGNYLMADYTVLAEVGESLMGVLWQEIQIDPQVNALIDNESRISLESPFDLRDNDAVRLSIYLYRIVEDANCKNQWPIQINGSRLLKAPLTLELLYLVTPLVGSTREQQILLGKVMQVLYDRAILESADLIGSLASAGEEIRVILNPVGLEELTRVWQAMEMSYRLSIAYLVRVAIVDSRRQELTQPVVSKQGHYGSRPK
jgi:Pvc16 N-terminal domain